MRIYQVNDEIADWIDKWAHHPSRGGFQNMMKRLSQCEVDSEHKSETYWATVKACSDFVNKLNKL